MSDSATLPPELGLPSQAGVDVRLDNFEGPLDLLLFLIKKNDLVVVVSDIRPPGEEVVRSVQIRYVPEQ